MGEWRGWREYSYGKQNPADDEEFTMSSFDKEFCESCSISMEQLIDVRKMMDFYQSVLQWDDPAVEEAFRNAKDRYWAKRNQLPCDIPLPSHDFYLTKIDWNSEIDPELLRGTDRYNSTDDEDDISISRYEDTVQPHGWIDANNKLKPTGWDVPDESAKPTGRYGTKLPTYVGYIDDDDGRGYPNTCQSRDVGKNSSREEQCSDNGRHNSNPSCGEWKNFNYGSTKVDSCSSAILDINLNGGGGNRKEKYESNIDSGRKNNGPAKGSLSSSRDQVSSRKYRSKDQSRRYYGPAKRVTGCSDDLQDLKLKVPWKNVKYPSNDDSRRRESGNKSLGIPKWEWVPVNGLSNSERKI